MFVMIYNKIHKTIHNFKFNIIIYQIYPNNYKIRLDVIIVHLIYINQFIYLIMKNM